MTYLEPNQLNDGTGNQGQLEKAVVQAYGSLAGKRRGGG